MKSKEAFEPFLEERVRSELRWAIIKLRFFNQKEEDV
jgi:hypothetical protein